jgi:hypothetical protein
LIESDRTLTFGFGARRVFHPIIHFEQSTGAIMKWAKECSKNVLASMVEQDGCEGDPNATNN